MRISDWSSDVCSSDLSSSHDILRAIGEGRGPAHWLVALGYAGWAPGQLEEEMVRHGWHVTPGSDAPLFDTQPGRRWQAAFADAGIDARPLATEGRRARSEDRRQGKACDSACRYRW